MTFTRKVRHKWCRTKTGRAADKAYVKRRCEAEARSPKTDRCTGAGRTYGHGRRPRRRTHKRPKASESPARPAAVARIRTAYHIASYHGQHSRYQRHLLPDLHDVTILFPRSTVVQRPLVGAHLRSRRETAEWIRLWQGRRLPSLSAS